MSKPETPDAPPPSSRPVSATLAEARRVLDEDVTPGNWQAHSEAVFTDNCPVAGNPVCCAPDFRFDRVFRHWPANARVLAAARRAIEAMIAAVEGCYLDYCGSLHGPAKGLCSRCREMLAVIADATGQTSEGERS